MCRLSGIVREQHAANELFEARTWQHGAVRGHAPEPTGAARGGHPSAVPFYAGAVAHCADNGRAVAAPAACKG